MYDLDAKEEMVQDRADACGMENYSFELRHHRGLIKPTTLALLCCRRDGLKKVRNLKEGLHRKGTSMQKIKRRL